MVLIKTRPVVNDYCVSNCSLFQMPSGCCSNCLTKYSLFNPENGCSNCAYSFCSKCIGFKALLPRLANKPVSVCHNCYQKINNEIISTSKQIPENTSEIIPPNSRWWGNDLPPPSFRQTHSNKPQTTSSCTKQTKESGMKKTDQSIEELEQKLHELKKDDTKETPTLEEIENRLAALRECDVELIRNPRNWFAESQMDKNTSYDLLKNAQARIELNERNHPDRLLEKRHKQLKDDTPLSLRFSIVSTATDFSEGTNDELRQIDSLLEEAEKSVNNTNEKLKNEKDVQRELSDVLASGLTIIFLFFSLAVRQKSLELEDKNVQVQKQFNNFWMKQIDNELSDDNSEEVTDEMVKQILKEAESAPAEQSSAQQETSHKKKNIFAKLFKR